MKPIAFLVLVLSLTFAFSSPLLASNSGFTCEHPRLVEAVKGVGAIAGGVAVGMGGAFFGLVSGLSAQSATGFALPGILSAAVGIYGGVAVGAGLGLWGAYKLVKAVTGFNMPAATACAPAQP